MATPRKESSTNAMNQGILRNACPVNDTLERLSPRWKMQVLFCIDQGQDRFSVLKDLFPSLSDHMLGKRLRELEREHLVVKQTNHTAVPPQVRYTATPKGLGLLQVMGALYQWEQLYALADEPPAGGE